MMKRLFAIFVILSLAFAGSLPKDARFDQPVSPIGGNLPLQAVLEAMAKSVGLSPLLREIPNVTVNADFDKKPFRQVWDLLINVYGDGKLDYAVLDNNVIIVGPTAIVERAKGEQAKPPVAVQTTEPTTREFYQVRSSDPGNLAAFIRQEIPGVTVSVAPGQNVLVVTATAKQQADVAALLARVDAPKQASIPIVQKSFALSHARAGELAKTLNDALASQAQGNNQQAQGQQGQGVATTPTATIVAEPRTNTIIVTGTADQLALVERLIPQLDRPIQQVQLQVRVQTVNNSVFRNLGIKWESIGIGNLFASIIPSPAAALNLIFDSTRSLSSLNIRAVLDALEGQQLSRRLSDANLLVEDNYGADTSDLRTSGAKGAELKSGGKLLVPLKIADKVDVREFDFGLLVRMRPQVTNDGSILLEIFTQTGDPPRDGAAGTIVIPQQSTLSKMRLKDGQTVVLGGLIQKTTNENQYKVPLLGDIPLLGELFKSRDTKVVDEELIVIITANIVKDAAGK